MTIGHREAGGCGDLSFSTFSSVAGGWQLLSLWLFTPVPEKPFLSFRRRGLLGEEVLVVMLAISDSPSKHQLPLDSISATFHMLCQMISHFLPRTTQGNKAQRVGRTWSEVTQQQPLVFTA